MLLSVIIYKHKLTLGQWVGTAVVFAGISIEAWVKRRGMLKFIHVSYSPLTIYLDVHAKRVIQEKEKARIKIL